MDDLDGCFDGCSDGCTDIDFDGCWPFGKNSGGSGDSSSFGSSYGQGYVAGVIAGEVADSVAEAADERREKPRHGEKGHVCVKPERVVFRIVVRAGFKSWLDQEFVEFGRTLEIVKINRYGLSLRLRPRWSTCWVIAFCTSKQKQALRRQLCMLQKAYPDRIKHYK